MSAYTGTLPSSSLAVNAGLPAAWSQQTGGALTALGSAMTTYTPTLTGFTLGNGTVTGRYTQVGKFVWFEASLTFGTTTTAASATPTFTLPVTAAATAVASSLTRGTFIDQGVNSYQAFASVQTTTTVGLFVTGTNGLLANPSTTSPFTWGNTDAIYVAGVYQAA